MIKLLIFNIILFSSSDLIRPIKVINLNTGEPSAISCIDNDCVIASDNGKVFTFDVTTNTSKEMNFSGEDFEGIYMSDEYIYVLEERSRKVEKLNLKFEHLNTYEISYNGRLNRGFEGIVYNPDLKRFIVVTETNPCILIELNEDFQVLKNKYLDINELSDITFYGGMYWLLSEEDHCIYIMDPNSYRVEKKIKLNIIGAEGICFVNNLLFITSDKLSKLFVYDVPNIN